MSIHPSIPDAAIGINHNPASVQQPQSPSRHPISSNRSLQHGYSRSILQGMSSIGFISQPITAPILPTENPIKTETLAPFMAEFTKTIIEALKSTNLSQRQIERIIECIMCGGKHGIHDCKIVDEFAKEGKCCRNHENKVVLPNGSFVPRYITGRYLADRIEEWHRQNPIQQTVSTMSNITKAEPSTKLSRTRLLTDNSTQHMLYL